MTAERAGSKKRRGARGMVFACGFKLQEAPADAPQCTTSYLGVWASTARMAVRMQPALRPKKGNVDA